MAKPSYTLIDDFELKGIWWLPDNPDLVVSGVLSFENERKLSLELLGSFYDIKSMGSLGGGDYFKPEIILGVTDNGLICTLLRNYETQNQINMPGIRKSIIKAQVLLIGKHFNKSDEICFSSFQANFTNLEHWLSEKPFSMTIPEDIKNGVWNLSHKWPPEFNVNIEDIGGSIESTHEFKTDGDLIRNVLWKSKAFLKITPDSQQHFEWFWGVVYDLCNLLTLLIGETTYITQVKGFGNEIEIAPGQKTKETIEVFITQKKPNINEAIYSFEMILPFPRIAEEIENIFFLWFSKSKSLRSVYDLFFGTFYNPGMYLQFQFLSLMQAIESFHRVTCGGKYLSDEKWQPYKEKLTNEIPKDLESSHKDSLKSRIKYGNEYSLRKRLDELLKTFKDGTAEALSPHKGYFTGVVVDTRNYLTHYDDELKSASLEGADLYWANQRLRILITILLLKEIGVKEEIILSSMKENNKISQILQK